jgi:hypothetical protein
MFSYGGSKGEVKHWWKWFVIGRYSYAPSRPAVVPTLGWHDLYMLRKNGVIL